MVIGDLARATASAADVAMDFAIVPGFSRIGYAVRSRTCGWQPLPSLEGRTCVVTGGSGGLGYAICAGLLRLGADVVLVARSAERAQAARIRLEAEAGSGSVDVELCDLSLMAQVRELSERLAQRPALHVLVHNAGVLPAERTLTAEGNELALATNLLAPFLLTELVLERLRASAPARVIAVSSGGMYAERLQPYDLQHAAGEYSGVRAYARTKRAQVVLGELWAQRWMGSGVTSTTMHPGWADTPGLSSLATFRALARPILRPAAQGADTVLWLAAASGAEERSGGFFCDRRERPTHRVGRTRELPGERAQLWRALEQLTAG